jgi:hypothetical protein
MVEQLSIFLENESGDLANVVGVLARAGVDIRAASVADDPTFGILRVIVDDPDRAAAALRGAGITVRKTPVVAVEIPDRKGGLASVLNALRGTNVEYMYAFVKKSGENALVVFRFEDSDAAVATLVKAGAKVLDEEDLRSL